MKSTFRRWGTTWRLSIEVSAPERQPGLMGTPGVADLSLAASLGKPQIRHMQESNPGLIDNVG